MKAKAEEALESAKTGDLSAKATEAFETAKAKATELADSAKAQLDSAVSKVKGTDTDPKA